MKFMDSALGIDKFKFEYCVALLLYKEEIWLIAAGRRLYLDENLVKLQEYM